MPQPCTDQKSSIGWLIAGAVLVLIGAVVFAYNGLNAADGGRLALATFVGAVLIGAGVASVMRWRSGPPEWEDA